MSLPLKLMQPKEQGQLKKIIFAIICNDIVMYNFLFLKNATIFSKLIMAYRSNTLVRNNNKVCMLTANCELHVDSISESYINQN